ncbi:conjugal transfer protein TraI [Flaviaesturariibacter amylovorans]|uniref:Conjugal transfer protein TraI n=1 Tax=Flaviaesturariibacter amylovorans TaxID=1084520 RepID=A0ABP8HI24_9BACT
MKKHLICLLLAVFTALARPAAAQDPITLIIKEGIKKVIVAVDLKIQRIQTKTIWLQNAQKAVENTMSKLKLDEISEWTERQRKLYSDYFEELRKVKDALAYYHRLKSLIDKQRLLVEAYGRAWSGVRRDRHFTPEEVAYMGNVYSGILAESVRNLEGLQLIVRSFTTQMSDGERLALIDKTAAAIEANYADLRAFTNGNVQLSLQRSRDLKETAVVRNLYGLHF